jgi:hypothetical protein
MFWVSEAQTAAYEDPHAAAGEVASHYLANIVIWAPGSPKGVEEGVRMALASVSLLGFKFALLKMRPPLASRMCLAPQVRLAFHRSINTLSLTPCCKRAKFLLFSH